jgi:hypothetical protein
MIAYSEGARVYNQAINGGYFKGTTAPEVIDILAAYGPIKDQAPLARVVANGCTPNGVVNSASLRTDLAFCRAQT